MMAYMNLSEIVQEYVATQERLLDALRNQLKNRDWKFLTDVPRRGSLACNGDIWRYEVHGVGVRFETNKCSIDANRGIDQYPAAFDAGRLVEYVTSLGASKVHWQGHDHTFDYQTAPALLREAASIGEFIPVVGPDGEMYLTK